MLGSCISHVGFKAEAHLEIFAQIKALFTNWS